MEPVFILGSHEWETYFIDAACAISFWTDDVPFTEDKNGKTKCRNREALLRDVGPRVHNVILRLRVSRRDGLADEVLKEFEDLCLFAHQLDIVGNETPGICEYWYRDALRLLPNGDASNNPPNSLVGSMLFIGDAIADADPAPQPENG
ncbi:unnamed protein product, partial [marine sediment metagenome]